MSRGWFRRITGALAITAALGGRATASEDPPPATLEDARSEAAAGATSFRPIARVLRSPRCQNCHPKDDRPRVGDHGVVHAMNISRRSNDAGLPCASCHRERNAPIAGGPPGAPHWGLPPRETPMVFEGRSPAELCAQLKDPTRNGGRDFAEILHHLTDDPLVLWAWDPGPGRTKPPLTLDDWRLAVEQWRTSGGACPE